MLDHAWRNERAMADRSRTEQVRESSKCPRCGQRLELYGMEAGSHMYCCTRCAREAGYPVGEKVA